MPDGAQVFSSTAIAQFETALGRFADRADVALAAIRSMIYRRITELRSACDLKQDEVESLSADESSADEDDQDYYNDQLEQAQTDLNGLIRKREQAEVMVAEIERCIRRLIRCVEDDVPRMRFEVRQRLERIEAYQAVNFGSGFSVADSKQGALRMLEPPRPVTTATSANNQMCLPLLPEGFAWVPLNSIDLDQELAGVSSPKDFQKVGYEEMRNGLERLKSEILPEMATNGLSRKSGYWGEEDRKHGRAYSDGLQRIFDAFFASCDFIYLERSRTGEKFTITNGRHRIKAARDAGWDMIPAKTKDLRPL